MAKLGNKRKFYLVVSESGNSTTYTWLAGEQTNSLNRTADAIEVSDKETDWKKFIYGTKGATAEVTVFTDDESTSPQKAFLKALHEGQTVKCFCGELNTGNTPSPSEGDAFDAIVNAISDTNDNGAVATRNLSLTVTDEVTHYPAFN